MESRIDQFRAEFRWSVEGDGTAEVSVANCEPKKTFEEIGLQRFTSTFGGNLVTKSGNGQNGGR